MHARLVTENRPTRELTRRIDREHSNAMTSFEQAHTEGVNERTFADAWHTRNTDTMRTTCHRQNPLQEVVS
jgi:hypothetical protein